MNIAEVRRENLRAIVATLPGGQAELAERLGKHPAQINQWIGKTPTRDLSTRSARAIEDCLGLEEGALDTSKAPSFDADILADAITYIDKLITRAHLDVGPRERAAAIIQEYEQRRTESTNAKEDKVVQFSNKK